MTYAVTVVQVLLSSLSNLPLEQWSLINRALFYMRSVSYRYLNHVVERAVICRGKLHIPPTKHHHAHKVKGETAEPAEGEGGNGFGTREWVAVEAGNEVDS